MGGVLSTRGEIRSKAGSRSTSHDEDTDVDDAPQWLNRVADQMTNLRRAARQPDSAPESDNAGPYANSCSIEMGEIRDGAVDVRRNHQLNAFKTLRLKVAKETEIIESSKKFLSASEQGHTYELSKINCDEYVKAEEKLSELLKSIGTSEQWTGNEDAVAAIEKTIKALKEFVGSVETVAKGQNKSEMPSILDILGTLSTLIVGSLGLAKAGEVGSSSAVKPSASLAMLGVVVNVTIQAVKGMYKARHIAVQTDMSVPARRGLLELNSRLKLLQVDLSNDFVRLDTMPVLNRPGLSGETFRKNTTEYFGDEIANLRTEFNEELDMALEQYEFEFLKDAPFSKHYLDHLRRKHDKASLQLTDTLYKHDDHAEEDIKRDEEALKVAKKELDDMLKALKGLFDKPSFNDYTELVAASLSIVGSLAAGILTFAQYVVKSSGTSVDPTQESGYATTVSPSNILNDFDSAIIGVGGINVATAAATALTKGVYTYKNVNRDILKACGMAQEEVGSALELLRKQADKQK